MSADPDTLRPGAGACAVGLRTPRKHVLLSAFACSPRWGSEPGVGWHWLEELVVDHDVTLLTHSFFREHLDEALKTLSTPIKAVHYIDARKFGLSTERYLNSRAYYVWWQWRLRGTVAHLVRAERFDVVHHLTWGTFRFPCFLGGLGVPLVMGPLGGGESAPLRLMRSLPWRARAFEVLRSATLLASCVDPMATWGPRRSVLVLCRTSETRDALSRTSRQRAELAVDIGAPEINIAGRDRHERGATVRLLFAGRLIGWKGISLAVGAMGLLRAAGVPVTLDIAGDGALRNFLEEKAAALGVAGQVRFHGFLTRDQLFDLYDKSDLFFFPSLHDSSGSVVLEALSRGLPVVCLDLGGPKHFVDESCGAVVQTDKLTERELEARLAAVVGDLTRDRTRLQHMSQGAARQAARLTWRHQVRTAYAAIARTLAWHAPGLGVKE